MNKWISTKDELPEQGVVVETKIDDDAGIRNENLLIYFGGHWFFTDLSLYAYYFPTHWRKT